MSNLQCALRGGRLFARMRPRLRPLPQRRLFVSTPARFDRDPPKDPPKEDAIQFDPESPKKNATHFHVGGGIMLPLPHSAEDVKKWEGPLTEEDINAPDAIPISIYEEDPSSPGGERLIQHIRTPEERRKHNELYKMMQRAEKDPNYDDSELNRHLLDDLLKDPNLADLTDELMDIKENLILSKPQQEKMLAEAEKAEQEAEVEAEKEEKELESAFQMATYESLAELMDDPEFAHVREELAELQDNLPEMGGEDSEFQAAMDKVVEKLGTDPKYVEKATEWQKKHGAMKVPDETEDLSAYAEPEDMQKLLKQMKGLMTSLGMPHEAIEDEKADEAWLDNLEDEMERALNEDPEEDDLDAEEERAKEMSFAELGRELLSLAQKTEPGSTGVKNFGEEKEEGDAEPVDPALEAKVDQIMKDPKLMEKLMYIQKIIEEEQQKQAEVQRIGLAPDPEKLEPHRITSIRRRMQQAKSDPEHRAALEALRVHLVPPFNIAPALRIFNEAIEYAYIGANDDIRRILWRAYSKARSLPTFLQNLSDDAWDIMYYSQAVTWGSNQNRESHLRLLLQDLRSVGKEGPPTHPSVVAEMQK